MSNKNIISILILSLICNLLLGIAAFSLFLGKKAEVKGRSTNAATATQLACQCVTPTPNNTPTSTPAPTSTPTQTPGTISGIGEQVDTTTTDNYVNNFILAQIKSGHKQVGAAGAWWGDPKKPFLDQIWSVNITNQLGRVYTKADGSVPQTFACLLPGEAAGKGQGPNNLDAADLDMIYQFGHNESVSAKNIPTEQFRTLSQPVPSRSEMEELRTDCKTTYNEGPFKGDLIRVNFDTDVYWGSKINQSHHISSSSNNGAIFDVHGWYTGVEYVYGGFQDPSAFLGKTLSGKVLIKGWASKNGGNAPIHHHGLKVEQNGDDYWVEQLLTPANGSALSQTDYQGRTSVPFELDTTKLSDGWHIISYHTHAIDQSSRVVNGTPTKGNQLAAEIKLPVCVDNHGSGVCK